MIQYRIKKWPSGGNVTNSIDSPELVRAVERLILSFQLLVRQIRASEAKGM